MPTASGAERGSRVGAGRFDLLAEAVGGRHVGGEQAVPEVAEVLVEGAGRDAGPLADLGGGDAAVAVLGERLGHRREQPQALVLDDQVGGDAVAAGGQAAGEGRARREGPVARRSPATSRSSRHRPSPSSWARSRSSRLLGLFERLLGRLVAQVGADREVHQLGQGVPDAARVARGQHVAEAGLDAADDEDAGRLRRRLGGIEPGADAVERRREALGRLFVLGQRRAAGDLHLDEERAGDRRPLADELEEADQAGLARPPPAALPAPPLPAG